MNLNLGKLKILLQHTPSLTASSTDEVIICVGSPPNKESELFNFKINGSFSENLFAPCSKKPRGAAYALQPASMAKLK